MDIRHLRYFIAVAEALNFTAAARTLGMAQPPLSVQVRKLEKELGCALFDRSNRQIALTAPGRRFLEEARAVVARSEQALRVIQDEVEGRIGELCLAYTDAALSDRITQRLRKFMRRHRGLRLVVKHFTPSEGLLVRTESEDALIAEFLESELPPGAIVLEKATLQIAVPPKHRLADRTDCELADLIGETVIVSPHSHRTMAERALLNQLRKAKVPVSIVDGSPAIHQRIWQVSIGLGCGICTSTHRGSLDAHRINLTGDHEPVVTAIVPNPSSQAAALPALIEAIRE